MDDKPAKTLEALTAFIQAQKILLAQTQSDIERLRELKNDVTSQSITSITNLSLEFTSAATRLNERLDAASGPPDAMDWSLFESRDPSALKLLAASSRATYAEKNRPYSTQRSELSELQKLVKDARKTILDPVLERCTLEQELNPSDSEVDHKELRREWERRKIRQLKQRQFTCGLTVPSRMDGVFIRCDLEDESQEVDILACGDLKKLGLAREGFPIDDDSPLTSLPPTAQRSPPLVSTGARTRRPTSKLQFATAGRGRRRHHKSAPEFECELPLQELKPSTEPGKLLGPNGKPRSETYKLAWSLSEQHLLERLLEEIPEGESQRWLKISKAMSGRRTPKQVASRVQKYFEKLKRFGLNPGAAAVSQAE